MTTLGPTWFESRWNLAESRAGNRYTPDLDVSLPIYDFFEAIGQDPSFFDRLEGLVSGLRKAIRGFPTQGLAAYTSKERVDGAAELLKRSLEHGVALTVLRPKAPITLPSASTVALLRETGESIESLMTEVRAAARIEEKSDTAKLDSLTHDLQQIQEQLIAMGEFLGGPLGNAANVRNILALGPAGTGKTHLLCEMTQRRIKKGFPSLMFLGQAFRSPFSDALEVLMKSVAPSDDPKAFLLALDGYARARSVRCVIAIDAINEGDRESWARALPALVETLRPYEGIALAVSCRTPFEQIVFPTADRLGFQTVFHAGYPADEQDKAIETYFRGYGIPLPEVPLLEEEFSNPLFLKLFCEALEKVTVKKQHAQINDIAAGQRGMTHILEYFVREKDREIAKRLGTPPGLSWRFLKNVFAAQLAARHTDALPLKDAVALADGAQPTSLPPGALFHALLEEDILAEDVAFSRGAPSTEVVRFTYQKFSDHLIARHLLSSELDVRSRTTIKDSLKDPQRLGRFFQDGKTALRNANVVQAIMIEFPTRIKNKGELLDFLDWEGVPHELCEAFVEGLYWREPRSINRSTDRLISLFLKYERLRDTTLNVLVALSVKPKHPFNFKLDTFLTNQTLVERDLFWTEYLRRRRSETPLRILIWAEHLASKTPSKEFAHAYVTVLKWFLTSTQRGLRDRVTHALFRIGGVQPAALFNETVRSLPINDPYVSERMLAASYGVAMARWQDRSRRQFRRTLSAYAKKLFTLMFTRDAKYGTTHILSRDYAQHTVQIALTVDEQLLTQKERRLITPPFRYGGLRQWQEAEDKGRDKYRSGDAPLGMDFANYTLGRLTPGRSAYDDTVPDYQRVKKQVLWRIYDLGYSLEAFSQIDQTIARLGFYEEQRGRENIKTERYGKKYAWIAFYELAGHRQDLGLLDPDGERISEADIDPSFPERPKSISIFEQPWIEHTGSVREWLHCGYRPALEEQLAIPTLDGLPGPWVVLRGSVNRVLENKSIFAFLDGLLVRKDHTARLIDLLREIGYPGNLAIPRPEEEHYAFAGEIPWAETWRLPHEPREVESGLKTVRVELPIRAYAWESYHSAENRLGGASFLAKELGMKLNLYVQIPSITMAERGTSRVATVTAMSGESFEDSESIIFLRQDLLDRYIQQEGLDLVVFVWGERRANYHSTKGPEDPRTLEGTFNIEEAVHKQGFVYESGSFKRFL